MAPQLKPMVPTWNSRNKARWWSCIGNRHGIWMYLVDCIRTRLKSNMESENCMFHHGSISMWAMFSKVGFYTGWWFGTFFIFPYIGINNINWLIFFRGVETTNQYNHGFMNHQWISDWCFGTMEFYECPFTWECHNPNWRTHIFQRGWHHQPAHMYPCLDFSRWDGWP